MHQCPWLELFTVKNERSMYTTNLRKPERRSRISVDSIPPIYECLDTEQKENERAQRQNQGIPKVLKDPTRHQIVGLPT
jgi:hypothetical protein